jgi:hypothetical protein
MISITIKTKEIKGTNKFQGSIEIDKRTMTENERVVIRETIVELAASILANLEKHP